MLTLPVPSPARLLNAAIHGAWAFVERHGAVSPGTRLGEQFGEMGRGACIAFPHAAIFGASSIHLGAGTLVGRHATLTVGYFPGAEPLPERALVVGRRCVIGARAIITAHEQITLGDDVWFGSDVLVTDASHGYQDPDRPIGHQMGPHQPVSIGSGTWVGHGAIILPGSRIGRNVVVAAGSVVRGVVEDHAVVGGVPAKVIRRYEPGVGWSTPDGSGEVRPAWSRADVAAVLGA